MPILLVMGVAGSGKTTIAQALAARTGWDYAEGDALHPPANVAKMAGGTPLTDDDRWPWLDRIAAAIDAWRAEGRSGIVTCSALKRIYRDRLMRGRPEMRLVYPKGDKPLVAARMAARKGHFMPTALLDSQFATLEEPGPDEAPIVVDIGGTPEDIAAAILAAVAK